MLETQSLRFAQVESLVDEFEGTLPHEDVENHVTNAIVKALAKGRSYSRDYMRYRFLSRIDQSRKITYVNCWHESSKESLRMWREYTDSTLGVAVQTDCQSLINSIGGSTRFDVGRVSYRDHFEGPLNAEHYYTRFLVKQTKFRFEKEVRAISMGSYWEDFSKWETDWNEVQDSTLFDTDMKRLIHRIVITPFASHRFAQQVAAIASNYGLGTRVTSSTLSNVDIDGSIDS